MSIKISIAVLLLAGAVSACATQSSEERASVCEATDWQRFGENDGRLGVPMGDRADTFEDCEKLGKPVDSLAYRTGRDLGLQTYCTVEGGYQVGYSGRLYRNVCPPSLEADFLQGYQRGRKERPGIAISPSIGIGIGSGGGIGVGIGIGLFNGNDSFGARGFDCRWPYRRGYPYAHC